MTRRRTPRTRKRAGFLKGVLIGLVLGLLATPFVLPSLAPAIRSLWDTVVGPNNPPPAILAGVAAAALLFTFGLVGGLLSFFQERISRPGLCINCDYDLTGNTSGTCPECGDRTPSRT